MVASAAWGEVTASPSMASVAPPGTGTSVPMTYTGGSPAAAAQLGGAGQAHGARTISASGSGVGSPAQDIEQSR